MRAILSNGDDLFLINQDHVIITIEETDLSHPKVRVSVLDEFNSQLPPEMYRIETS